MLGRLDESLCSSRQLDAEQCAIQFQQDLGFHMLSCGRNDLVREAIPLLGRLGVNSFNLQVSWICRIAWLPWDVYNPDMLSLDDCCSLVLMLIATYLKWVLHVFSDCQIVSCVGAQTWSLVAVCET